MHAVQMSFLEPSSERLAELELWRRDPVMAFDAFASSLAYVQQGERPPAVDKNGDPRPVSVKSRRIYKAMFHSFIRWIEARNRTIFETTTGDLLAFLQQRTAAKKDSKKVSRIRSDYLRLLKRVFAHLEVVPNPAGTLAFEVRATPGVGGRNIPTAAIPENQLNAFIANLPNAAGAHQWKRRRDRAMQALMLGCGLTVHEVVHLRTSNLGRPGTDGSMPVTISRKIANELNAHTTYLWPDLVPIVQTWVTERLTLNIGGELLFPAGPVGGARAKEIVNPTTVWRQANATYERAGISVPRSGGRTLRNTFAACELMKGTSKEVVGNYLGHREKRAIDMYDQAVKAFKANNNATSSETPENT